MRFIKKESVPLWIRDQLSFFSSALLVDWIIPFILTQVSYKIEQTYPFIRPFGQTYQFNDPSISFPFTEHERCPNSLLDQLSFWLPLAIFVVIGALRKSIKEIHHAVLALVGSRALMRVIVEATKNRVGRFRPDWLARCQWDFVLEKCTGAPTLLKDGRRSFPSGHSSTAFQGLFLVTLFLAGKNGAFAFAAPFPRAGVLQSRQLRLAIALSPLFIAGWVAISRMEDHRHHLEDVVTGSSIGIICATVLYLIYFPSPFNSSLLSEMDKPKEVYLRNEETELLSGRIRLEDELVGECGAGRAAHQEV